MPRMTNISRRLIVGTVLISVLVLGPSATGYAAGGDPIVPANRPTPLAGEGDGVVSPSRLVTVFPNCIAAREAGPSLARIFAMAQQAGVSLGAEECYRPLSEQVRVGNIANQPGNNPACVATVGRSTSGAPVGNSYHGWGKAADLTDTGRSLTFSSVGYAFMKEVAGSVGWNHPAFAEPGGSACPEPWHWEWVGDGEAIHASHVRGDAVALLPSTDDRGYATITGLGALRPHGDFVGHGSVASLSIAWVVI